MNSLYHRGPDQQETALFDNCGMAHTRLSIVDLENGRQPMSRSIEGHRFHIVYNGEIYNLPYLRKNLQKKTLTPDTSSDTETLLLSFLAFGHSFIKEVDGIFSFAVYDEFHNTLSLFRDPFGVKPLFYGEKDGTVIFGSEPKACFCYPGFDPELDLSGLNEIFSLGPARTLGNGGFAGIHELLPGEYMHISASGCRHHFFRKLEAVPHHDSYTDTIRHVRFLLCDSIHRQMVSDIPICSFLSGGLDSSLVTAICQMYLKKEDAALDTFSFDFKGNDVNFQANSFQSSQDRPFAELVAKHLGTHHTLLECDNETQADYLFKAVDARDFPCMADVESSMLYFCEQVSQTHRVALTGECADEIFGGYPWYLNPDVLFADDFPWSGNTNLKAKLISKELLNFDPVDYVYGRYLDTIKAAPKTGEESPIDSRIKEVTMLNLNWFMQTLLDRKDRMSMYSGLEVRVPFCDHRIIEYAYNIPWEIKAYKGREKGLLRKAFEELLPDEIIKRKKSPYPKSHHPRYIERVRQNVKELLNTPSAPIWEIANKETVKNLLETEAAEYTRPWYGQLMNFPQIMAYIYAINVWLDKYGVDIV